MPNIKKSDVRLQIKIITEQFMKDPSNRYLKGQIVILRALLGEDSCTVLDELHAVQRQSERTADNG